MGEQECEINNIDKNRKVILESLIDKQIATFSYTQNFKRYLLESSGLNNENESLVTVLNELTFNQENTGLFSVVAGSFAAFKANAVKRYRDIDVFVLIRKHNLEQLDRIWHLFSNNATLQYDRLFKDDILAVKQFGIIQIILKYYPKNCLCSWHVDTYFFASFHHVTRWKLDLCNGFFLPRYIYFNSSIIAKATVIDRSYPAFKESIVLVLGKFRVVQTLLYPQKHLNNQIEFGPPSLLEQSIRKLQ